MLSKNYNERLTKYSVRNLYKMLLHSFYELIKSANIYMCNLGEEKDFCTRISIKFEIPTHIGSAGLSYLKVAGQIIGGAAVVQTQLPWQIYVYMDNSWLCGGSLIAANWVLTAAHCVKG